MRSRFIHVGEIMKTMVAFILSLPFLGCADPPFPHLPSEFLTRVNVVADDGGDKEVTVELRMSQTMGDVNRGEPIVYQTHKLIPGNVLETTGNRSVRDVSVESPGYWLTTKGSKGVELILLNADTFLKEFELVLRRKLNPRPLFVKRQEPHFLHELDVPYGYDLEMGDWVQPNGKGLRSDLLFRFSGEFTEDQEFDITASLSFPQEGGGIIPVEKQGKSESQLLLGQSAPVDGYLPEFQIRSFLEFTDSRRIAGHEPSKEDLGNLEGFWFRTHTERNQNGEVRSARHGKLVGDIQMFYHRAQGVRPAGVVVAFTYFYSPDESRSLESDGTTLVPEGNMEGIQKR